MVWTDVYIISQTRMIKFSEYKGSELKEMPIDVGVPILNLNWSMSSGCISTFIYKNEAGDLFYAKGILQYTHCMAKEWKDDQEDYHLALVIPIVSKQSLIAYLGGKGKKKDMFDRKRDCYVMKLGAPEYDYEWSGKIETNYSMHPVVDRKEVTRKVEMQLKEFEFKSVKVCKLKDIDSILNPSDDFEGDTTYGFNKKLNFIFTSEEEKKKIKDFIKNE